MSAGSRGHRALQRRNGLVGLPQREIAGAEKEVRGNQIRLQLDGSLERCERLGFVTAHRERHAEVHQQAGLVRAAFRSSSW